MSQNATRPTALERLDRGLERVVRAIDRVEEVATSVILVIVIVINGMEIFSHSVLNQSLHWVYEINLLLGNWIYFLGICLVYYNKKDIVLEIVDRFISEETLKIYLIFINAIIVVILSLIIYYGWLLLFIQAKTKSMDLGIPNFYFSMPVVIGSVSIILIVVKQSFDLWFERRETPAGAATGSRSTGLLSGSIFETSRL